jgi:hypothetical protein
MFIVDLPVSRYKVPEAPENPGTGVSNRIHFRKGLKQVEVFDNQALLTSRHCFEN